MRQVSRLQFLIVSCWAGRALERLAKVAHQRTASLLGMDLRPFLGALERRLVRLTAWGVGLVAAYLWLTFAFHQFPYTRPWSDQLGAYLLSLLRDLGTGALLAVPERST